VLLKIVTNTIANRLKIILNDIVDPFESAFVPKLLITNNSILAYESFHYKHHNKSIKKGFVGIKLDMEKAYERVEWDSIEHTLKAMGFPPNLINVIRDIFLLCSLLFWLKRLLGKFNL